LRPKRGWCRLESTLRRRTFFPGFDNLRQPDPVDYFLTPNRMNRWRKFFGNEDFGAKAIIIGVR